MIDNSISDHRQLNEIRKHIQQESSYKKRFLRTLLYCGSKINFSYPGVALVKNKNDARFMGTTTCKSPWCCPVCTAKQMSKYAADIAVALDALKAQKIYAAMITFTVPHTSDFTCEDTTEILYNTWKGFVVHGNTVLKTAKNDVFSNFAATFNHKHRVRVAEYTYGQHGWHPHFHTLFWFPADKFQDILEWEEKLETRWYEIAKRETVKRLMKRYPKEYFDKKELKEIKKKVQTRIDIMYTKLDKGSHGLYISKTPDGKVIRQESSNYIAGWGGNREITGNYKNKATAKGHYTWQQVLQNAIDEDKKLNALKPAEGSSKKEIRASDMAQTTPQQNNKWWTIFFDYAIATRKYRHARINYSVHSGLKKIIEEWKKTQEYKTFLKKNATSLDRKNGKWTVVCWFKPSQWSEICFNNLQPEILELALLENANLKIAQLLKKYGILEPLQHNLYTERLEAMLNNAA